MDFLPGQPCACGRRWREAPWTNEVRLGMREGTARAATPSLATAAAAGGLARRRAFIRPLRGPSSGRSAATFSRKREKGRVPLAQGCPATDASDSNDPSLFLSLNRRQLL